MWDRKFQTSGRRGPPPLHQGPGQAIAGCVFSGGRAQVGATSRQAAVTPADTGPRRFGFFITGRVGKWLMDGVEAELQGGGRAAEPGPGSRPAGGWPAAALSPERRCSPPRAAVQWESAGSATLDDGDHCATLDCLRPGWPGNRARGGPGSMVGPPPPPRGQRKPLSSAGSLPLPLSAGPSTPRPRQLLPPGFLLWL